MSLHFGVWSVEKNGQKVPLFAGELPIRDNGLPLAMSDVVHLCKDLDEKHTFMPTFRLDMQRVMLLAEPAVLQEIAALIVEGSDGH